MVGAAMGYRAGLGRWGITFLLSAGGKENEHCHHTPCLPPALAWHWGRERGSFQGTHCLVDWFILACRVAWPNEEDHTGP